MAAVAADATTAMTIDFLRARLLSERSVSRAAKDRADQLAKRVRARVRSPFPPLSPHPSRAFCVCGIACRMTACRRCRSRTWRSSSGR